MRTISTILSMSILFVVGCSSKLKYVELNEENISELEHCKVKEVCISTHSHEPKGLFYSYDFFIKNPEKIRTIIRCIQDANHLEDYYINVLWPWLDTKGYIRDPNENELALRKSRRSIIFRTRKKKYETWLSWDDKRVYGRWWQSTELMNNFKKWNLLEDIANADPNWPAPDWKKNPPPESDPNFPPNRLPWSRYHLRMEPSITLTKENFSQLDIAKTKEICFVSKYIPIFFIDESERIEKFFQLMKNAEQIERDINLKRDNKLYFVVGDRLYDTEIYWDDKFIYGNWWQSSDLLKLLEEWGFAHLKQ